MSVLEALKRKHPESQSPPLSTLLTADPLPPRSVLEVTGSHVHLTSSRIQESAGPSGTDANHLQDVLLRFGAHSERLRDSVASLIRRLSNTVTPWDDIRALVAFHLIALDKCPGIRPIGIGETLRRIICKTVCMLTRYELDEICSTSQLCGGMKAGIEGAIHTVYDLFEQRGRNGWGVLMIDATNAFNNMNRQSVLWNSTILWPSCSLFLFNNYRGWIPLVVNDSNAYLYSKEGVTQGYPLSMFIYAVATILLIERLGRPSGGTHVWYADDAFACSRLQHLKDWFDRLLQIGPSYGYHPELSKCVLLVHEDHHLSARDLFETYGVRIVTSHRLLGGVVGDHEGLLSYVTGSVNEWTSIVEKLTVIAKTQPQLAYSAFTRSVQSQWAYLQRVVPDCGSSFIPLEQLISQRFIPTIFSCEISPTERSHLTLPARLGGLNIQDPTLTSTTNYTTSRRLTSPIVDALKGITEFDIDEFNIGYHLIQEEITKEKAAGFDRLFNELLLLLTLDQQRAVNRAKGERMLSWLTVAPVAKHHFDLSAQDFIITFCILWSNFMINGAQEVGFLRLERQISLPAIRSLLSIMVTY
uniref:Uncharacterized protein n=1 Tax=Amphimedon queenslandica TaxID=400682 RepID=A0A1X7VKB1_AMPQE